MSNNLMQNMLTEHTMEIAIKDKIIAQQHAQQEQEHKAYIRKQKQQQQEEFDPDFDDDDLKEIMTKMKQERIKELEQQVGKKLNVDKGIGEYREIVEEEFLPLVTKNHFAVVHFYHNDFQRCKVMDTHLLQIAQTHPECKFFYLNADKSPFFVQKLAIQVLPTLCLFVDGILKDRIVGFEDLGGKDQFETIVLTRKLVKAKMIQPKNKQEKGFNLKYKDEGSDQSDGDDDEDQQQQE